MAWKKEHIPVKATSGNYFWVTEKGWEIKDKVKGEIHVTVLSKDIDKTGEFKEFHVKFDNKSGNERIFFFFKGPGTPNLDAGKSTKEADAIKNFKVSKGEYSEMKAKAIGTAKHAAGVFEGQ